MRFYTRWFKLTFLSPSWRSLNLWKDHHPKKVTKNWEKWDTVFCVNNSRFMLGYSQRNKTQVIPSYAPNMISMVRNGIQLSILHSLKLRVRAWKQAGSQKERIVFQPSIFRCKLLVSGRVWPVDPSLWCWVLPQISMDDVGGFSRRRAQQKDLM